MTNDRPHERPHERTVTAQAGEQSIAFTREFKAPAALVFAAHTDPPCSAAGPAPGAPRCACGSSTPTGGCWSYVSPGASGEWAFHGSFHEVTAPGRLVRPRSSRASPATPRSRC